jgi:tape measure domain-containing protein
MATTMASDGAEFVVNLVDKISGPARKATYAIAQMTDKLRGYEKPLVDATKSTGAFSHVVSGAIHHVEGLSMAWAGFLYFKSGDFKKEWAQNMSNLRTEVELFTGKLKYGAIAGAAYAAMLSKGVLHMSVFADSSRRTLNNLAPGKGDQAFDMARRLSADLGMDVEDTTRSLKELLAMQFKPAQAEELIKLAADLRDVTGDAQAAERALLAMSQIKAKGRLQGQELTQQLANAGLSTALVYQELGKHYHKSTQQVQKMLSKGLIDADTGLAAIKAAIMYKLHEKAPGEAAKGYAQNTMTGAIDQLHQAPNMFFLRVAEAARGSLSKIQPLIMDIVETIKTIPTAAFKTFIDYMVRIGAIAVMITKQFFLGFIEGADEINKAIGNLDPGRNMGQLARLIGRLLAEAAAAVVFIMNKVARIMIYLNEHRWIIYLAVGLYTFKEMYQLAFMISHLMIAIGGAIWLWRSLQAGKLVVWLAKAGIDTAKWAWELGIVRETVKGVLRSVLQYYVTGPLLIMGWMVAIAAAVYLIIVYWDDIKKAGSDAVDAITASFWSLYDDVMKILDLFAKGELFTNAGAEAGQRFIEGFKSALWGVMKFTTAFGSSLDSAMKIGHWEAQQVGLESKPLDSVQQDKLGAIQNQRWYGGENPNAQRSDFMNETQSLNSDYRKYVTNMQNTGSTVEQHNHFDMHIDASGKDGADAGKKMREGVEKELAPYLRKMAAAAGVPPMPIPAH